MKKKIFFTQTALVLSVFFLCTNCMKEASYHAPEEIKTKFSYEFDGATSIEWSSKKGFIVANFRSKENRHTRAWFEPKGFLVMTETIDPSLYETLPAHSQKIFKEEYKFNTGQILDAYKIEFRGVETRYVIAAGEKNNPTYLFFRKKDGECFKVVTGKWENEPIIIPNKITQQLGDDGKKIKIIDAWREDEILKLRAGAEKQYRTLCYHNEDEEWIADYYKITKKTDTTGYYTLIKKKFPTLTNFKIYFVEYPPIDKTKNITEKCLFIKTEKNHLFVNFNGEEIKEIPESVTSLLSQIKIDH